jgi:hypothetical protein
MTRELIKPITVEIDGQVYGLKLDFTAMKDFEDTTGKSVLQFLAPIFESLKASKVLIDDTSIGGIKALGIATIEDLIGRNAISAGDLQAMLWACMGGPDSGKSLREAGRLIHIGNISEVASKLWEAVQTSLPQAEPGDELKGDSDPNATSPAG